MISRKHVLDVFKAYTDCYNSADEKIRLKIEHTYQVAKISVGIAESLGLSDADTDLAWLIGMLHDIGRFLQVKRYDTFVDAKSVDHAEFGADLLFQDGLVERFLPEISESNPEYTDTLAILELAIRQHNKFRICEGLTDREMMFCNIIRDADKIDILRVNVQTPPDVIYKVTSEELRLSPIAPEVMQSVREKHCVLRAHKKYPIDNLIGHIALVFELVYPMSRKLVKDQGYLDQMLAYESENPETKANMEEIRESMRIWFGDVC